MISPGPVRHHIRRDQGATRLCDGRPATEEDISTLDRDILRAARRDATLCPPCQQRSGIPPFALRPQLYSNEPRRTLAELYTVPALSDLDNIRNCAHCRLSPGDRSCPAWRQARRSAAVLQWEARRSLRDVAEIPRATGGHPATLYEFPDGSVGYLAPGAPAWREASELTGRDRERAVEILDRRATGSPGRQQPAGERPTQYESHRGAGRRCGRRRT